MCVSLSHVWDQLNTPKCLQKRRRTRSVVYLLYRAAKGFCQGAPRGFDVVEHFLVLLQTVDPSEVCRQKRMCSSSPSSLVLWDGGNNKVIYLSDSTIGSTRDNSPPNISTCRQHIYLLCFEFIRWRNQLRNSVESQNNGVFMTTVKKWPYTPFFYSKLL